MRTPNAPIVPTFLVFTAAILARLSAQSTWTTPVPLNTNAHIDGAISDFSPSVARGSGGTLIAAWVTTFGSNRDYGIAYSRSLDNGLTWSDPLPFYSGAFTDGEYGSGSKPDLATDGRGCWIVVWEAYLYHGPGIGSETEIMHVKSADNGMSWSDPAPVNTDADFDQFVINNAGQDYDPRIASDSSGNWVVVWWATKPLFGNHDFDVVFAVSSDLGESWTPPAHVNIYGSQDSGDDRLPGVVSTGKESWMVVWSSTSFVKYSQQFDYDLIFAQSRDNGRSWTDPMALNSDAATDSRDDNGRWSIAGDGRGRWMLAWDGRPRSGGNFDIFFSTSMDNAASWSDISILPLGIDPSESHFFLSPSVATNGIGTWILAFHTTFPFADCEMAGIGRDGDILFVETNNFGKNWSPPAPLNLNAFDDLGGDHEPRLLSLSQYEWIAVWTSYEANIDGADTGTDSDLLRSFNVSPDSDDDEVADSEDNCPTIRNELQADSDQDGIGDACDACVQTPPGTIVDSSGRPKGDHDGDCDVDLADLAVTLNNFGGPIK